MLSGGGKKRRLRCWPQAEIGPHLDLDDIQGQSLLAMLKGKR